MLRNAYLGSRHALVSLFTMHSHLLCTRACRLPCTCTCPAPHLPPAMHSHLLQQLLRLRGLLAQTLGEDDRELLRHVGAEGALDDSGICPNGARGVDMIPLCLRICQCMHARFCRCKGMHVYTPIRLIQSYNTCLKYLLACDNKA